LVLPAGAFLREEVSGLRLAVSLLIAIANPLYFLPHMGSLGVIPLILKNGA